MALRAPENNSVILPPLSDLGAFDHYTVVVENGEPACDFHVKVLGFRFIRTQHFNTGTVPRGEVDMLNFVLEVPGFPDRVCIITQGLTEETIFRRYVKEYGEGIQHVAYRVPDLDARFAELQSRGVRFTSSEVLRDPLTGLRQVFIAREHGGYFIELIERTAHEDVGHFTENNMHGLARTMETYLSPQPPSDAAAPQPSRECSVAVRCPSGQALAFIADPGRLHLWTTHRTVRKFGPQWLEVRAAGDLSVDVATQPDEGRITYRWSREGAGRTFSVLVEPLGAAECRVHITLPPLEPERLARTRALLTAELRILQCLLEERPRDIAPDDRRLVDEAHLEVYRRVEP